MRLSIAFTMDSVTFTADVIAGTASLGGSESACIGLARALQARGHDVHIFVTKLGEDAPDIDAAGVTWHPMARVQSWMVYKDFDVAIALRQPAYLQTLRAKWCVLWNQDLMPTDGAMKNYVMSLAWAYDAVAYVSDYHRRQWEHLVEELTPLGWVTKNGHDAALAAAARASAVKKPHQIIHISRPERGLLPLLRMWPALKQAHPEATLALCRYSSMYDAGGWGEVCKAFDRDVEAVNAEVGGITYLGELGKPALYQAIAESAVMWYPGVSDFAETSCIAAVEAQACGTPLVASFKGALPETCPAGIYIHGAAESDPDYQAQSVAAVGQLLDDCRAHRVTYRQRVAQGLAHVEGYTYEVIAAEWERWLLASFAARYAAEKVAVLHRLDHDDDMVTAAVVARELPDDPRAQAVLTAATCIMAGREHTADDYAKHALNPVNEIASAPPRHQHIVKQLDGCRHVLDVAGGNGAIAIMLAQADPDRRVTSIDYSQANIDVAKAAAVEYGVADRITFLCAPVWDMDAQTPAAALTDYAPGTFDGAVCGEFLEHTANAPALIDAVERTVAASGRVVFTVPMGPLGTLVSRHSELHRGHAQCFRPADLDALFGQKPDYVRLLLPWAAASGRGEPVGAWLVSYRPGGVTGARDLARRILARPYFRLSVGIISNNAIDLRKCLDIIWATADEIVVGDGGLGTGDRAQLLVEFPRKVRFIDLGDVTALRGGFAEARNRTLAAATGDWFLWIDSDEILCGAFDLGKYLDGPLYQGFSIPQNHLYLDGPMGTDTPTRVFRRRPDIAFYGCVHEQPQMGDCNGDIAPCLQLADVQIAHTGYLYEGVRRHKALSRNLPLLVRDQEVFPARHLGTLLVLREHANIAMWERERTQGAVNDTIKYHYGQVIALFEAHYTDPAHRYHGLARPFYEQALSVVNGAIEMEIAVAARANGLHGDRSTPTRVWARTVPQLRALLINRIDAMLAGLMPAPGMDCAPIAARTYDAVTESIEVDA